MGRLQSKKQNMNLKIWKLTICICNVLHYQYMDLFSDLFSHVFLIFNYWSFNIGMLVLRSLISVPVSKQIFGKINKLEERVVQISTGWIRGSGGRRWLEKKSNINKRVGDVYLTLKRTFDHTKKQDKVIRLCNIYIEQQT